MTDWPCMLFIWEDGVLMFSMLIEIKKPSLNCVARLRLSVR